MTHFHLDVQPHAILLPPSEKKCTDEKLRLRVSKTQFLNFWARVSELKVPLRDKVDGMLIWLEQCNKNHCFFSVLSAATNN